MNDALKPLTFNIDDPYLSIQLDEFQSGLEELIADSGSHFPEPFDELWWEIATEEGAYAGEVPPSQLGEIIARCDDKTLQVRLKLYRVKRTQFGGLKLFPAENYVFVGIDFRRNWFVANVSITGLKQAKQIEPYIKRCGIDWYRVTSGP